MLHKDKIKAIVILGAGHQQIPAISRAHFLGYDVVSPDLDPNAVGLKMVEYPLPGISTHDPESIISEIKKIKNDGVNVSGVIAVAVEHPIQFRKLLRSLVSIRYQWILRSKVGIKLKG